MKKDINYYLNLPYNINLTQLEDGDYFAQFNDKELNNFVLLAGDGKTPNEAIKDLREAFACYLEEALKNDDFIPEPVQNDKSENLAITLKNSLIDEIDFYAKKMGLTRSAFLALSAKAYIKSL